MKAKFIELTNGEVYLARTEPETASENPLTDRELVILNLHKQIENLKKVNNLDIPVVSVPKGTLKKCYNGQPCVDNCNLDNCPVTSKWQE